jgi:hypothetical protein
VLRRCGGAPIGASPHAKPSSRISIPRCVKTGSTPVAPAFGTDAFVSVPQDLVDRLEVGQEGIVRLHGDDLPVLCPDLLEE